MPAARAGKKVNREHSCDLFTASQPQTRGHPGALQKPLHNHLQNLYKTAYKTCYKTCYKTLFPGLNTEPLIGDYRSHWVRVSECRGVSASSRSEPNRETKLQTNAETKREPTADPVNTCDLFAAFSSAAPRPTD